MERLELLTDLVTRSSRLDVRSLPLRQQRLVAMLSVQLWTGSERPASWQASLDWLRSNPGCSRTCSRWRPCLRTGWGRVRCRRAAKAPSLQAGVRYHEPTDTDVLLVTLRKSERDYSLTTLYDDYAISPELFHWESQSVTSREPATGQRYLTTNSRRGQVLLFVRETKRGPAGVAVPYVFLGRCRLVEARGDRPIAITWRLERAMPRVFF